MPDRGRLFALRRKEKEKKENEKKENRLEFYSPHHGLKENAVVEISGLTEGGSESQSGSQPSLKDLNGQLFRVEEDKDAPNWFSLKGLDDRAVMLATEEIVPIHIAAALWSTVYNRGPVMDLEKPDQRDNPNKQDPSIVVISSSHGLKERDHIRFSGSNLELAGLGGLYSVKSAKQKDRFVIACDSGTANALENWRKSRTFVPSIPVGRWERVENFGPIKLPDSGDNGPPDGTGTTNQPSSRTGTRTERQKIRINAPAHGLECRDWVTQVLSGPQWAERLAFCVEKIDEESFQLGGTENLLTLTDCRY